MDNYRDGPRIYILIGPPCIGKTTWAKKHVPGAYVVSRDAVVEHVAQNTSTRDEKRSLTYDEVVTNKSFSEEIDRIFNLHKNNAVASGRDIVVDMTNMEAEGREFALNIVAKQMDTYEKIAVVFEFSGFERQLMHMCRLRAEDMGDKNIPTHVYQSMFDRYEPLTAKEMERGFDRVIQVDTRDGIQARLNEFSIERREKAHADNITYVTAEELRQRLVEGDILPIHVKGFAHNLVVESVDFRTEGGFLGLLARVKNSAETRDNRSYLGGVMIVWDGDAVANEDHSFTRFIREIKDPPWTVSFAFSKAFGGFHGNTHYKNIKGDHSKFVRKIQRALRCAHCPLYFITEAEDAFEEAAEEMKATFEAVASGEDSPLWIPPVNSDHYQALRNYHDVYKAYVDNKGRSPTFAFLGEAIMRCTKARDVVYIGMGEIAKIEYAYSNVMKTRSTRDQTPIDAQQS